MTPGSEINGSDAEFLRTARTGHLATADTSNRPHVIPVCFVFDGEAIYIALDQKPKTVPLARLRRVRNILANPQVSLVTDHYEEDWDRLRYVLVSGRAEILEQGEEAAEAIDALRGKYPQYRSMDLDGNPVIKIIPERITPWRFSPTA